MFINFMDLLIDFNRFNYEDELFLIIEANLL